MHFVLVHGSMHGAWCWYKIAYLLQQDGHTVTAINLKSAGTNPASADSVQSFEDYNQPLMGFLTQLPPTEQIVLVGHSFGGVSLSYASEAFADKIAVAVYVCAYMICKGDSLQLLLSYNPNHLYEQCIFNFENGPNHPPTSRFLPAHLQKHFFYGTSPSLDASLASLCLRPTPLSVRENICLETTEENYGQVPRVFIKTEKDNCFLPKAQDMFIASCPPHEVYSLDCDHSPFFSQPNQLHQLLLEIATRYGKTHVA